MPQLLSGPHDLGTLAALAVAFVLLNYVVASFLEHLIHRFLMHGRPLPQRWYRRLPYLGDVFEAHALRHHGRWYRRFDHEPDPVGREENLAIRPLDTAMIVVAATPLWALELLVWAPGAAFLVGVIVLHSGVWNAIHRQMHLRGDAFFRDWAGYRLAARYHFLHHRHPTRNFNLVCPLADHLLGRVARPSPGDLREMLELGLVAPRGARACARLGRRPLRSPQGFAPERGIAARSL
jgi:hypothetical protein